jgi:hypothetical protein
LRCVHSSWRDKIDQFFTFPDKPKPCDTDASYCYSSQQTLDLFPREKLTNKVKINAIRTNRVSKELLLCDYIHPLVLFEIVDSDRIDILNELAKNWPYLKWESPINNLNLKNVCPTYRDLVTYILFVSTNQDMLQWVETNIDLFEITSLGWNQMKLEQKLLTFNHTPPFLANGQATKRTLQKYPTLASIFFDRVKAWDRHVFATVSELIYFTKILLQSNLSNKHVIQMKLSGIFSFLVVNESYNFPIPISRNIVFEFLGIKELLLWYDYFLKSSNFQEMKDLFFYVCLKGDLEMIQTTHSLLSTSVPQLSNLSGDIINNPHIICLLPSDVSRLLCELGKNDPVTQSTYSISRMKRFESTNQWMEHKTVEKVVAVIKKGKRYKIQTSDQLVDLIVFLLHFNRQDLLLNPEIVQTSIRKYAFVPYQKYRSVLLKFIDHSTHLLKFCKNDLDMKGFL